MADRRLDDASGDGADSTSSDDDMRDLGALERRWLAVQRGLPSPTRGAKPPLQQQGQTLPAAAAADPSSIARGSSEAPPRRLGRDTGVSGSSSRTFLTQGSDDDRSRSPRVGEGKGGHRRLAQGGLMAVGSDDEEDATGGVDSDANRRLAHGGLMAVGGEDEKPASDGVNTRPRHTARSGLMAVGSGDGANASDGVDASTHEYDELHTMEAPATHVVHPPRVPGKPGDATAAVGEPDWVTRQDLYSATSNSDSARSGPAASIDARVAAVVAAATAAAADTTHAPRSDAGSDVLMASVDLMRAKHMVDAVGMGGDGDDDGDSDGDGGGGSVSSGDVTHDSSGTFTSFASPHHQSHDTDRSDSPPGTPNPLRVDHSDSGGKTRAAAHPRQVYGRKPTGAGVAGPVAASEMAYDTADSLPVPVDAVSPPRASMRAQRHAGGRAGGHDGDSDGGSNVGSGDSDGDGAGDLDDGTSRAELGLPHSDDGHSLGASQDDPAPRSPHRASARYRWSRDRELWHDHDTGDDTSGLDDGRAIRDDAGRYRRTRTHRVQRYHHVESRGHPLRRTSASGSDGSVDGGDDVGDEVFTDDPAFTPDEDDGEGDEGDDGDGGDSQASGDVYSAYSGASASDDGAGGATNTTDLSMVHHELSDLHALLNKRALALTERARAVAAREEKIKRDVTVAVARMAAQAHKSIMQVRPPLCGGCAVA